MSDVKKSALWALINIPIYLFGFLFVRGLVETGNLLLILYIPTYVIWEFIQNPETPEWFLFVIGFLGQYLVYSLIIYGSIKVFRVLKRIREENSVEEQLERDSSAERHAKDPTEIWDLFHDGTLIKVEENAQGNLVLTVELEYVREMFDEEFKYFLIELHECSLFEFSPSIGDIKPVKDVNSILKYDLWMTDVATKNDEIQIYCADGILKTEYKDYSITLDTGTRISTEELRAKADEAVKKSIESKE